MDFKTLIQQVEIKENKLIKCIAKKKNTFSLFSHVSIIHRAYDRHLLSGHSVWHIIVVVLDPDKSYSYG